MKSRWGRVALMLLVPICGMACTHPDGRLALPSAVCSSDTIATVSFAKDIQPLLQAGCALSGCHSGKYASGNLDLDSDVAYTNLFKSGTGYIDTLQPDASLLYSQMVSTTSPMPPLGRLDDCKTGLVLKWIQQKARR